MTQHHKETNNRVIYSSLVALTGMLIFGWAISNLTKISNPSLLVGLIFLNAIAQLAATSTQRRGVAFGVSQAANLAAVSLLGLESAIIVASLASLSLSLIRIFQKEKVWKNSIEQVAFNASMETIAIFIAGISFLTLAGSFSNPSLLQHTLPWIVAAILFDQVNLWILSGVIYFQRNVHPCTFMRNNAWAMPINVTIGIIGGYLLNQSIEALGWQGILLFVFPLMLSAYSLRMYIKETDRQMDVVLDRTTKLSAANVQLQQMADEKNRMLAVLSHDMRTSLSALQASAELLQLKDLILDAERRGRLHNVILKSGSHLTSMVENILNIEQASQQPLNLNINAFNISESTQTVVDSLESLAEEKAIELKCKVDDLPVIVSADRQMLHHIILNLVSNAIKYTPNNGHVSVTVHAQPHCVLLEVQDDGFGIPAQEFSRIFDPYYRIETHSATVEGSGLGLAIVKYFVEAHDGSIDVASKVNEGSRFIVRLPYKKTTPVNSTPNLAYQTLQKIPALANM